MKKIKVLIWEGLSFPEDTFGVDLILHEDPSSEIDSLDVKILNPDIISLLKEIFADEMLEQSEEKFFTVQLLDEIESKLNEIFEVEYIQSEMTPQFLGGRITTKNGKPFLN